MHFHFPGISLEREERLQSRLFAPQDNKKIETRTVSDRFQVRQVQEEPSWGKANQFWKLEWPERVPELSRVLEE